MDKKGTNTLKSGKPNESLKIKFLLLSHDNNSFYNIMAVSCALKVLFFFIMIMLKPIHVHDALSLILFLGTNISLKMMQVHV